MNVPGDFMKSRDAVYQGYGFRNSVAAECIEIMGMEL